MLSNLYVQNVKKLDPYYERLEKGQLPVFKGVELTEDDILRREVITELMCNFYLDKKKIEQKYNLIFDDYFADALEKLVPLQQDGLIELQENYLKVTTMGRLLIRNIAMQFDYYLAKKEGQKPQFSRTV
ncbi:MAG TPA: coproporphyrinogen III oxidase, partial [Caldithrix abyssi]|nr:coproporphyrinogen III oxidase [Caldithrix abyssi]